RFDVVQYVTHGIRRRAKAGSRGNQPSLDSRVHFKFVCPECNAVAWGAPDLRLICGTCHKRMKRDMTTSEGASSQISIPPDAARGDHARPKEVNPSFAEIFGDLFKSPYPKRTTTNAHRTEADLRGDDPPVERREH